MSAEFSRRSFLKYTALTAVAVAGSTLLTGCSGETSPVQSKVGTTNTVLKVKTTLDKAVYDAASKTLTFEVTVNNGRINSLEITSKNFSVVVPGGTYYANRNNLIRVFNISADPTLQVKNGVTQKYRIVASEFPGFADGAVRLTYQPDFKYDEYTANWLLDKAAVSTAAGTSTTAAYSTQGLEV